MEMLQSSLRQIERGFRRRKAIGRLRIAWLTIESSQLPLKRLLQKGCGSVIRAERLFNPAKGGLISNRSIEGAAAVGVALGKLGVEFLGGGVVSGEQFNLRGHLRHLSQLVQIASTRATDFASCFKFAAEEMDMTLSDSSLGRTERRFEGAIVGAQSLFVVGQVGPAISGQRLHRARSGLEL